MKEKENRNTPEGVEEQILLNTLKQNGLARERSVRNEEISETEAPDGGLRAWMVMVASFFCFGTVFGIINSYSVLYSEILNNLKKAGIPEASSKAALVGSLAVGVIFAASPLAGILSDKIGIRRTVLIGGVLATLGMFSSSFVTNSVEALCVTYGVIFGLGAAFVFMPSLTILSHYFYKYLGLVNGIVLSSNSIFTIVMPFVIEKILKSFNLEKTFWVLSTFVACIIFWAILFKPLPSRSKPKEKTIFKGFINISIWKNKRYLIWIVIIPLSSFGIFVPYVYMKEFVDETFPGYDGKLPIMCIGITSGLGRIIFGYIADLPKVDWISLQQISLLIIGIVTMCLPFCSSFVWLLALTSILGLFDGCFETVALLNIFDICGSEDAAQGIGFHFGISSIPLIVGPPIAGMLYDHSRSYQLSMILAGIPLILGSGALFLIKCVK